MTPEVSRLFDAKNHRSWSLAPILEGAVPQKERQLFAAR
jgi:hypothetical protein